MRMSSLNPEEEMHAPKSQHTSTALTRRRVLQGTLGGLAGLATWHGWPPRHLAMAQKGDPAGQMTWAMHITLAPTWFDPAETGALLTPYHLPLCPA